MSSACECSPQPRRTARTRRIAVAILEQSRGNVVGEDVFAPQTQHIGVQTIEIGKASAKYNHSGIKKMQAPGVG